MIIFNFIGDKIPKIHASKHAKRPIMIHLEADIQDQDIRKNCIIKLDKVFRMPNHDISVGRSLDALNDTAWDYFYENWLNYPEIYITGWKNLTVQQPIFAQEVIGILYEAYQGVCIAKLTETFNDDFRDIRDRQPKIYLI